MHDYTPNPRTDAVQSRGKLDRSLQKAVATSCSLAFGNHTRMARIIDLEATCHCRLSLASTHVRSRPSRSLTYVSDRSDDDAVASPHNHAHNKPHQHTYISHRLSIDHLGQRPLGRSQMNTTITRAFNNEADRMMMNKPMEEAATHTYVRGLRFRNGIEITRH